MITSFKIFENANSFLLCFKEPDTDFHWKFTKGKKYKIYRSSVGTRVKDDNGNFCGIDHWCHENIGHITTYQYAGCYLTTAESIEDFKIRYDVEKYNL